MRDITGKFIPLMNICLRPQKNKKTVEHTENSQRKRYAAGVLFSRGIERILTALKI